MTEGLVCWKCGASLAGLPQPLARREACPACSADLHVCRLCEFYDTGYAKACREPVAEPVQDKTRANFCGHFQARPGAYRPEDERRAGAARAALDAMFGGVPDAATDAPVADAPVTGDAPSEAEHAREQLEKLFGLDKK